MADDVREWRGAEFAAESFMEPLSRDYIRSRKAAEHPHAHMAEASVALV